MSHHWRCPKCGNQDIVVTALVDVALSFDDFGDLEGSEPVDANHEWDDDSPARCDRAACRHDGTVRDFCVDVPGDEDTP